MSQRALHWTAFSRFLHVDYTIDASRTQYVLSVGLDRDGVVRSVRMES